MNRRRLARISEEIKKLLSDLILNEIKDPRVNSMTSITDVEVTGDLSIAKIYISILGDEQEKKDTLEGLQNASGFIRKSISDNIDLRHSPKPEFFLDESIEQGMRIAELLDKVNKDE